MSVSLIIKIFIGRIEINHKTSFDDVKDDDVLFKAYELLQNNAYPRYAKEELLKITTDNINIIVSNHMKWNKEKRDNPEWFNVL